jgi:hypothetical protein
LLRSRLALRGHRRNLRQASLRRRSSGARPAPSSDRRLSGVIPEHRPSRTPPHLTTRQSDVPGRPSSGSLPAVLRRPETPPP